MYKKKSSWAWGRAGVSILLLSSVAAYADMTGTAFSDFNGDGVQQAGEVGRAGIIVKAFQAGNPVETASAVTDASGQYTLKPPAYPVRVEFSFPTDTCGLDPTLDFPATNGDKYGTSTQFASADGEVHNFIFNYPADFSTDDNPRVFLTRMANGDPLAGGDVADFPAVMSFHYQDSGVAANSERGGGAAPAYDVAAIQKQVGSVYGTAYSRQAKKVFVSAFMKRHSGMGPLGGGGIYMLNAEPPFDTAANVSFVDLDAIGVATSDESGAYSAVVSPDSLTVQYNAVIGTNTERGLPSSKGSPNADPVAYSQVGKVSLGDMDISEDGRYLYVVNLYDRKLYELDLTDPAKPVAPTAAKAKGFAVPNACSAKGGEARPFGLKIARGKAYVGVTCSGEDASGTVTGATADMTGDIFEFDLKAQTWNSSPLVSFPFDYREVGGVDPWGTVPWHPWSSTAWTGDWERGEPLVSDIEFDNGGNFIIGVMDVRGHRLGHNNYNLSGTSFISIATTGETLRAARDTSVKACKYNIQTTPEFYNDNLKHAESSQGALAVHHTAASDQVMSTFMDPVDIWSAGVHLYNNKDGSRVHGDTGYEVFYSAGGTNPGPANFGKAAGLGDLETVEIVPSIEIGNRVWLDVNKDGIQDGNEAGLDGVDVTLKCGTDEKTIQTANGGQYYFTNVAGGNATFMDAGESCTLSVDNKQTAIANRSMSPTDAGGQTDNAIQTDIHDSDAKPNGTTAEVAFTVGNPGENNHSLDFGYLPAFDLSINKTVDNANPNHGDTVVYTLVVTNAGPDTAPAAKVTDVLPAGITYVSDDGAGSYDSATGIWTVGDMAKDASKTLKITAKVN